MRKAWASFILFLVFCCSLSAAGAENMAIAVEGVYDGVVSAMASYLAVPRVALQGVTVVSGKGLIPSRISFVRSDVSTYADSLSFFSGDVSFSSDDGTPESLPMKVVSDRVVERLRREGFSAGEVILDGSVRVVETPELDALSLLEDDDWSGCIYVRCSLSMLVTGTLAGQGEVVEGIFTVKGGPGCTIVIETEELAVNKELVDTVPIQLSF